MLSLKPLSDHAALAALYRDPYIARVGHDHRPAGVIEHPAVSYLGAYVGHVLVGAFLVIRSNVIDWDLHALLRRSAIHHSRAFGRLCLAWAFGHQVVQRVTAYIIQGLEAARNYCLRLGFKDEGMRRDAVQVAGELRGVHILGLTRRDWEAVA